MDEDPIVTEVREAGHALAEQAGGDLHTFFSHLRAAQEQYRDRLVRRSTELRQGVLVASGPGDKRQR